MSSDMNSPPKGIILVPMDVASSNTNSLTYAAELCENRGLQMLIVHAVHEPAESPGLYQQLEPSEQLLPAQLRAERICKRLLGEVQRQFPQLRSLASAQLRIVVGLPAQRIVEVANQADASLIVMTGTKRQGWSRLLNESIADSVSRKTRIPVLRLDRMDSRSVNSESRQTQGRTLKPEAA